MERIKLYQVDAFTDKLFHGNPAAVCLLAHDWLNDELMQAIAAENNLSETAFVLDKEGQYYIRWFSPNGEIDLCGHATLAAGYVLFAQVPSLTELCFISHGRPLTLLRRQADIELQFPVIPHEPLPLDQVADLIDQPILSAYCSPMDWVVILKNESAVKNAKVDLSRILSLPMRGLAVSAAGEEIDFYSRCFYPKHNIFEDPVTGSAHCLLVPIWAERLNKRIFVAKQGLNRQGTILCEQVDEQVMLRGECRLFLEGFIEI